MPRPEERLTSLFADLDPAYVEDVYVQVLRYAAYRARSKERGRDLAHDVILQALDPAPAKGDLALAPWDRDKNPDLAGYLMGQIDGAIARERRAERLRRSPEVVASVEAKLYSAPPTPEQLVERRESHDLRTRLWDELRGDFAAEGDEAARLAIRVMDEYESGATEANEQAQVLGVDIQDVYLARRRIQRRAEALLERETARESDLEGEGPDAMESVYEDDDHDSEDEVMS
jgi:hypothetical protein